MDELSATDRCVKCGLCLPHCPTFALTGNEADSPRGRISLMQWLAAGGEVSPGLREHIDRCLQCGACEAMCPSRVPFGELMDSTRARLAKQGRGAPLSGLAARAGAALRGSPAALRLAGPVLDGYRRSGLASLLARLPGTAGRANRLLTRRENRPAPSPPSTRRDSAPAGRLHLFPGCTGRALDRQALDDAQVLLGALGYEVTVARNTVCCGAIDQHRGQPGRAAALAARNRAALDDNAPVVSIASGCAARLRDYDRLSGNEKQPFAPRVHEIMEFLARHGPGNLRFRAGAQPVGVHLPCTQRNALGAAHVVREVLAWIPGLEVRPVNPEGGCCGAAGTYLLEQPEIADSLGDAMAARAAGAGANVLLTTNIGCALHLAARLRAAGQDIVLMHPVSLLRRMLLPER